MKAADVLLFPESESWLVLHLEDLSFAGFRLLIGQVQEVLAELLLSWPERRPFRVVLVRTDDWLSDAEHAMVAAALEGFLRGLYKEYGRSGLIWQGLIVDRSTSDKALQWMLAGELDALAGEWVRCAG